jgi:hypothetical protein
MEWFKILDASTWKIEDLKTKSNVSVYLPNVELANYENLKKEFPSLVNIKNKNFYKINNGFLLFEFTYEPLLDLKDFNLIVNNPEEYQLLEPLYSSFLYIYFQLYKGCIKWYKENSMVKGAFDFEEQIELYQNVIIDDDYCCPILKDLDTTRIQNINFKKAFVQLLKKSLLEKITSLNILLHGTEDFVIRELKYTAEAKEVINTIINIVYRRFNNFLNEEQKLNSNKQTKKSIRKTGSLSCFLSPQQLKLLHRSLIEDNFINDMKIENFINCLSGKKIDPSLRIQWKKSKRQACYLFSHISTNFQISKLNATVKKSNKIFDSNDYSKKSHYADLLAILNKIDPHNKNFATLIRK